MALRRHLFRSLSGVAAEAPGGARPGVRCGGGRPSPATQARGVCSEFMVPFVCVMENVDVVVQQSMASVPTCYLDDAPCISLFTISHVASCVAAVDTYIVGIRDVISSILSYA